MRKTITTGLCLLGVMVLAYVSLETGVLRFNYPSRDRYPVWGIDVSHHQGRINWRQLTASGLSFAYIKATEGGDFVDPRFATNWAEAGRAGLRRGAYHFFTFCRSGSSQVSNLLTVVPSGQDMLAPVVDVEYGGNCRSPPPPSEIRRELHTFLDQAERAYRVRPILYVTSESHRRIVRGHFPEHGLWVRDVFRRPRYTADRPWLFWQYSNRGRLPGITGPVDLNVFSGRGIEHLERSPTAIP